MDNQTPEDSDSPRGLVYALLAYGIWGTLPVFMKALAHVPASEIIAHRVLWSLPVAGAVLVWQGRGHDVIDALRQPRMLAMGTLTAVLISINWLIYVWSIANDRALDAALGYYINPLFSVVLGATLLKEKLSKSQIAAILLAAAAVIVLTIEAGRLPLVSVALTVSFGLYAFCKKRLPLGANQGFMLEVVILCPFAVAWLIWINLNGQGHFGPSDGWTAFLLIACGPVTAVPLMCYANGAKLLRLSTIGILQYLTPTAILLCAVFLFHEPISGARLIAFPMIWGALVIYSIALIRQAGARRQLRKTASLRMQ